MEPEDKATNTPASRPERRKEPRHSVDGKAILHLLDIGIRLRGRVLDLSMNGCQFSTDDCFPMGIYRRTEIEFNVEGMPFRLAGVTQSIHKKHIFGIRFLDVSERKRQQLVEIIAEIQESLVKERSVEPPTDTNLE